MAMYERFPPISPDEIRQDIPYNYRDSLRGSLARLTVYRCECDRDLAWAWALTAYGTGYLVLATAWFWGLGSAAVSALGFWPAVLAGAALLGIPAKVYSRLQDRAGLDYSKSSERLIPEKWK